MHEETIGKMKDLEAELRGIEPLPLGINRDRLLFEAGRRSVRAGAWRNATLGLSLACIVLAAPWSRPLSRVDVHAAGLPATAPPDARVEALPGGMASFGPAIKPSWAGHTQLPPNTRMQVQIVAELLRDSPAPLRERPAMSRVPPTSPATSASFSWAQWAESLQRGGL